MEPFQTGKTRFSNTTHLRIQKTTEGGFRAEAIRAPESATVKQLLTGVTSLIAMLAATIGLLIFAAAKVPSHFNGILIGVVPPHDIGACVRS